MDVHYSSGIFNKAFYLLATTPDSTWDVQKAFKLFAKANQIWGPGETFNSAYGGLITAADLLGYPAADVTAAFAAVGVPVPPPPPACDGVSITPLGNGESSGKVSATTGEWKCWTLDVPAGALTLDVVVRDTSKRRQNGGDADLYIRHGSSPVVDMWEGTPTGVFDCGSYSPNSNEQCSIESPADGIWYFAVYAWSSYLSMEIKGTSAPDGSEPPSPSGVITATASVKGGKRKFVQVRWEGAESPTVDIYRDDAKIIAGTANDGSYKDNEGGMGNLYKVCEEGLTDADACSDPVTAN
jgi:vibriolysin